MGADDYSRYPDPYYPKVEKPVMTNPLDYKQIDLVLQPGDSMELEVQDRGDFRMVYAHMNGVTLLRASVDPKALALSGVLTRGEKSPPLIHCTGFPTFYEDVAEVRADNGERFRVGMAINGSALYFFPEGKGSEREGFYALLMKDVVSYYAEQLVGGHFITEQQAKEQGK